MNSTEALFRELSRPFSPQDIKTREGGGGRKLKYATARSFMNRLDDVVGPENWWDDYSQSEHSVVCRLSIRLPDGRVLTKMDAGGYAGMSDQGDDDKSAYSDAFKRACVKFGPGRHLYNDGVPSFPPRPWYEEESEIKFPISGRIGDVPVREEEPPPVPHKDPRSFWNLFIDKVTEINRDYQSTHPEVEEVINRRVALEHLWFMAHTDGKIVRAPEPDVPEGQMIGLLTDVYKSHRNYLRATMRDYFAMAVAEADRPREEGEE
jgi:hypothetical protein